MSTPSIVRSLQKLDLTTLERLAGPTIVRAVRAAYDTNREKALGRLVVDRFGTTLLQQVEVRRCLIESMNRSEAVVACNELDLRIPEERAPQSVLMSYFDGPFTERKAKKLLVALNLPLDLLPQPVIDEREPVELISAGYGERVSLKGYLHPYQKRLKDEVLEAIGLGYDRQMAQMPTGAGKTFTALEVIVDHLRRPGFKELIVWVVDSNELAEQALQAFADLWKVRGDSPIRAYRYFNTFSSDFSRCEPGVVFSSFAKVYAAMQSDDEDKRDQVTSLSRRAKLLVIDEAHTSMAETYEAVVRRLISGGASLVGLSATPGRRDPVQQAELARLYGQTLISIRDESGQIVDDAIAYLRRKEYLAAIEFEELLSGAESSAFDEGRICAELAEHPERNQQIIGQIKRALALDESSLVFSCTKDHVLALVALCRSAGIEVGFIIGETPQPERVAMLERFREGQLRVLVNHEILSTGIDLPNVDRLIITRPIGSPILYSQVLGRALRGPRNGGNVRNTVVNIKDNLANYPSASHVYEAFRMAFSVAQL